LIAIVLLHGFGATAYSWRNVVGPLSACGQVHALDREWVPVSDAAPSTAKALDTVDDGGSVLIGHSAGAELAALVASRRASRVRGLVLESPVIGTGPPAVARQLARLPLLRSIAPVVLRSAIRVGTRAALAMAWADKSTLTPATVDGYRRPLLEPGATESIWRMTAAGSEIQVDWGRLQDVPCLIIRGDRDRWVTPVPLSHAATTTYQACGHIPHEEQPHRFVSDVINFITSLDRR
jgi:pimeloyl-ACP methyl ester carboxylesterase